MVCFWKDCSVVNKSTLGKACHRIHVVPVRKVIYSALSCTSLARWCRFSAQDHRREGKGEERGGWLDWASPFQWFIFVGISWRDGSLYLTGILILHVKHVRLEMSFELVLPRRQIITFLVNLFRNLCIPTWVSRKMKRCFYESWTINSSGLCLVFFPCAGAIKLNLLGNLSLSLGMGW